LPLLDFLSAYREDLPALVVQHLLVVLWALPLAAGSAIGLGVWLADRSRGAAAALGVANILTTVPSLALFGLLIPLLGTVGLGVGRPPAILAVALYSVLPILRNTIVGLRGVPGSVVEAARGMGLDESAILWRVRLPLALPIILAGIRTAFVMGIGITAIAAYVGAGGLGRWVFGGIRRSYPEMALAGALAISVLAFAADALLAWGQAFAARRLGLERSAA
jgi:osmoprotectant transport system permease protein